MSCGNLVRRTVGLLAVLCCLAPVPGMAQVDPYSIVFENGDSANRVDMIFAGDGYQESELGSAYVTHVNGTLNHFFSNNAPFTRYQSFFNAYRVNIISNESGADDPNAGTYVDTALDASYNWGGTDRCLYFNTSKANAAVNAALSGTGIDVDMRLGTVNSTKYGGCGGQWGVYAGGHSAANEIAIHEIGHSFGGLADEYFYTDDVYSGGEFSQWNVTNSPNSGKWDRWVGYDDPDTNIGVIGYYEGGRYFAEGVWRPSDNSKMRALNRPFDAISREKFIYEIYEEVDPLDAWIDTGLTYNEGDQLWVDRVDDDVISLEWSVDGQVVAYNGSQLDLASLGLNAGSYTVSVMAYDNLLDHSFSGDSLDWWRLDGDWLSQNLSWTVQISAVPEPGAAGVLAAWALMGVMRRRRALG